MSEVKVTASSTVLHVSNESHLPPGKLVSFLGDDLEISEKARKEMLAWDISKNSKREVWILSTQKAYNNLEFMQLCKKAEDQGYQISKKGLIEVSVLTTIYDRRSSSDNQKASGDDSIVINLFEVILADAMAAKASDIHIEVRPNGGIIRMRVNGDLMAYRPEQRLSYNEANNLCSVMYTVLASTKSISFDPRDCQQAEVNYSIMDSDIKLRYQSVPAYQDGYDVILRLLPIGKSEDFVPLQKLGYTDQQVEDLINISARPVGSLIIAGVTGSGKSTTLKNLLMYINAHNGYKIKIYSIEDPPEYNIAKITQIPVVIGKNFDPTKLSPFEKPIKACMRGDPDIIMIGEVRDKITGDLTKKAVQSGHQVLTTVHATSGLGIIDRFQDFGLSRSVLGAPEFLTGLLYQKLLPVVCDNCSINFNEYVAGSEAETKDYALYARLQTVIDPLKFPLKKRKEGGCEKCNYSGVSGRSVAAEVITVDLEMLRLIASGETIELIKYWRSQSDGDPTSENMRGKTCMEHGFQKVLAGFVCPEDLEKSFKPISEMLMEKPKNNEDEDITEFKKKLETDSWAGL